MADVVNIERTGRVAVVTIDRPEARNAISPEVATELSQGFRAIEQDDDIWAAILTGSGTIAFSAGADLKTVAAGNMEQIWVRDGGFAGFVELDRRKPVIAAVNGAALAGGCELVLACDMVVAADHAKFGLPEVSRGIIAAAGGIFRLPLHMPRAIALELVATGDPISAAEAHRWGLVNQVVPSDAVLSAALELANRICKNGPLAVRESLGIARRAHDMSEQDAWNEMVAARDRIFTTNDAVEGPRAFVEKRDPIWSGT